MTSPGHVTRRDADEDMDRLYGSCQAVGLKIAMDQKGLLDAYAADEALLTETFAAQTPVSHIDGKSIGNDGGRGPVFELIVACYKDLIRAPTG